ncbi:MAG TPA: hypothetical protein VFG31_03600 [Conexibacter sp.]|nr:hypothetical protein [Conexibacter sp.]
MKYLRFSAVLLALALAVAAVVLRDDRGSSAAPPSRLTVRASAQAPDVLGVFSQPHRAADILPARLIRAEPLQPGELRAQSRRVRIGRAVAYVWPARDSVCYLAPVGGGCMPVRRIAQRGVDVAILGQAQPRTGRYVRFRAFGLVRDGIARVELVLRDGRTVVAPVVHNAFYGAGRGAPPVAVRWNEAGRARHVALSQLSAGDVEALR